MPLAPPTLTDPGLTPDRSDRATFSARAIALDDFRKNTHLPELRLLLANVYANAVETAFNAGTSASAAVAINAVAWVSGTTYAIGNARYSLIDLQTYRRKTAGAGTTDPSADGANWARLTLPVFVALSARASNTALAPLDAGNLIALTGTFTQTLSAAATLGAGWWCYLRNSGNGDITLDPNAAELIDGALTYILKPGYSALLTCSGTDFTLLILKERTYPNVVQYTASGTLVVPPGCYVLRPYAFGAGAAGTVDAGGFGLGGAGGGCAYGDIAVTPGQVVTLTIAAGVATVVYGGVTLLTGGAASGVTAGTASKHASVTNGGAYSGGGAGTTGGGGASSGSPLGVGINSAANGGAGWGGGSGGFQSGGGVGGAANFNGGGPGLSMPSTDPLLFGLNNPAVVAQSAAGVGGANGIPGTGASVGGSGTPGKEGGFGGGGGSGGTTGGVGGFGGGGGRGGGGQGAAGGLGGGGGGASLSGSPAPGGAAAIRIYY